MSHIKYKPTQIHVRNLIQFQIILVLDLGQNLVKQEFLFRRVSISLGVSLFMNMLGVPIYLSFLVVVFDN